MRLYFKFLLTFFLLYFHSHSHSHVIYAHDLCQTTPLSSESFNQLSRARKSNNITGVYELKTYLSYYGYLNHKQHQGHDNIFDDSLELALKMYQQFHNFNVSGVVDNEALAKLCQSHCNMLDFPNPSINTLPFHVRSKYSFLQGKPKWHTMSLTYAFDWNVRSEAKTALQLALNEWASTTPFKFHMVKNFSRANIKFSFMTGDHGDGFPFVGPKRALGHTFPPPDGRIHFDNHQIWSWTGKKNAYDIQSAGLHELGHALGLGHSSLAKAVMYPVLYPRERKRTLQQDDINGIKALYKFKGRLY